MPRRSRLPPKRGAARVTTASAKRRLERAHVALVDSTRRAERAFVRALGTIMRGLHDYIMASLHPAIEALIDAHPVAKDAQGARRDRRIGARLDGKPIPHIVTTGGKLESTHPSRIAAARRVAELHESGDITARLYPARGFVKPNPVRGASAGFENDLERAMAHVLPQIGPKVREAHAEMSNAVIKGYDASMAKVLPVSFRQLAPEVQQAARDARNASIALVENAGRDYAASVRGVFHDAESTVGYRWENFRDDLLDRGDVSESRANLIARDQTLKLAASINEANFKGAGLSRYTWNTSNDERVRPMHADLDGMIFEFEAPPVTNDDGDENNPGEDYQCRCIAIPVVDDLLNADLFDDDEGGEG